MASGRHWALYATNLHLGTHREHRLSAARLGPVRVALGWTSLYGWKAEVGVARVGVEATLRPRKNDPRVQAYIAAVMGRMDTNHGLADANAGRLYEGLNDYDGPSRPSSSWKPDDPQPPVGWHHDGERWVQNEVGWWRDRHGYWRYNVPGDPGWKERPDGSWFYVAATSTEQRESPE